MLEGAIFPPIVIFQDKNGWKHLADGHHRVDATALAALKDNRRKAEVLAEIRAQLDGKLAALARPFRAPSARLALNQIGRATDFLDELETYITEGYRSESEARE